MATHTFAAALANDQTAILRLGELHAQGTNVIDEQIANLIDGGATDINVHIGKHITIDGNQKPITKESEMLRIGTHIGVSEKDGTKMGKFALGLITFVASAEYMEFNSQFGSKVIFLHLNRSNMSGWKYGSETRRVMKADGVQYVIREIGKTTMKQMFKEAAVINRSQKKWLEYLKKGVTIRVNGKDISKTIPIPTGTRLKRVFKFPGLATEIIADLIITNKPTEYAKVMVTHVNQACFSMESIDLFKKDSAFTKGMLHGTITGDAAPINSGRSGFKDTPEYEKWLDCVLNLEDELKKIVDQRLHLTEEAKQGKHVEQTMDGLRRVLCGSEFETSHPSIGPGDFIGPAQTKNGKRKSKVRRRHLPIVINPDQDNPPRILPRVKVGAEDDSITVPGGRLTSATPDKRVVREKNSFGINILHPDYVDLRKRGSDALVNSYCDLICVQEVRSYAITNEISKKAVQDKDDEFMGIWTKWQLNERFATPLEQLQTMGA